MKPVSPDQVGIPFGTGEAAAAPLVWLGTVVDHREFFGALQEEWLPPSVGSEGRLLGVCRHFDADGQELRSNSILVWLRIAPSLLPDQRVLALRSGRWDHVRVTEISGEVDAIFWPGPIPTFAVSQVLVSSSEERARLLGISRQVANLPLPEVVTGDPRRGPAPTTRVPGGGASSGVEFPTHYDTLRGAAAMAWWAVPRVDPWYEMLAASFSRDPERVQRAAAEVEAPWLASMPWFRVASEESAWPLWRAALTVMASWRERGGGSTQQLVDLIVREASESAPTHMVAGFERWADQCVQLSRGDASFADLPPPHDASERAIQLALIRPDPENYKRWPEDLPTLPPAEWLSGSILCGLLHGYRRLPTVFRGEAPLRRYLTVHGLQVEVPRGLSVRRNAASVDILCGDEVVCTRPDHSRGRWFQADFRNERVLDSARRLAAQLGWPCTVAEMQLRDTTLLVSGGGSVTTLTAPDRLQVTGEVRVRLPAGVRVVEKFDVLLFKRCILIAGGGNVPSPPEPLEAIGSAARGTESRAERPPAPPPRASQAPKARRDGASRTPGPTVGGDAPYPQDPFESAKRAPPSGSRTGKEPPEVAPKPSETGASRHRSASTLHSEGTLLAPAEPVATLRPGSGAARSGTEGRPAPGGRTNEIMDVRRPPTLSERANEIPLASRTSALRIPGLTFVHDFISEEAERRLVAEIDRENWLPDLKRRVQHYGWKYDYKAKRVESDMFLGELPDWADFLAERLLSAGLVELKPDQVIVNEYVGAQGISKHVDCVPCFDDGIVSLSLLESWEMLFRKPNIELKEAVLLERRGLVVLTGESRFLWTHEIPPRKSEPTGLVRRRRLSVTFRKVRIPGRLPGRRT